MPEITNPQVVAFSNTRARPIADRLYQLYIAATEILLDYNSGNIGTLINDGGPSNLIADGSETDGRTRITGGDIYNLITAVQDFVSYVENASVTTANRTTVITKPHVNGL